MINVHFREPVSAITHLLGAFLSILGTIWLAILAWGDPPKFMVMIVFGASLVALYTASTALHLFEGPESTIKRLQRYDHAAIYIGIAGGYTPFIYHMLKGEFRWLVLSTIWGLALLGAISKLLYFWDGHYSTGLYVLMGWIGVFFAPQALTALATGALIMIVAGGVVYTIGAVIFALKRPNLTVHFGHHEVWHLFVMAGSAIHFAAVLKYIV